MLIVQWFCNVAALQVLISILQRGANGAATEKAEDALAAAGKDVRRVELQRPPGRNTAQTQHWNKSYRRVENHVEFTVIRPAEALIVCFFWSTYSATSGRP